MHKNGQFLVVVPQPRDVNSLADATGCPYPATAFVSFLEMYGLLGYDVCPIDELGPTLRSGTYVVVFICPLKSYERVLEHFGLLSAAPCVVLDGPIPDAVAARLGLEVAVQEPAPLTQAKVLDPHLRRQLSELFLGYSPGCTIGLEPISVRTSAAGEKAPQAPASLTSYFLPGPGDLLGITGFAEYAKSLLTRRGNFLIASFSLLGLIASRLSIAATDAPIVEMRGERCGESLDYLLLLAMARQARRAGRPLMTIEPWPADVKSVLTVRHDFDRVMDEESWQRLLAWERAQRVQASWYLLPHTSQPARIADIVQAGHEIGFHYRNLRDHGTKDLGSLRAAAHAAGTPLVGATCHSRNFHGQRDLQWLEAAGFRYAELLSRCSMFPFRPARAATGNSSLKPASMLVAARHLSLDRSVTPPRSDFVFGEQSRDCRLRLQAHNVIMNHPDINFACLQRAVAAYRDAPGVESWTQAQVVDWWHASHIQPAAYLSRSRREDGSEHIVFTHQAARQPVLRVWAPLSGDTVCDRGELHTLIPFTSNGEALIDVRENTEDAHAADVQLRAS